jgi:hypothetical protein
MIPGSKITLVTEIIGHTTDYSNGMYDLRPADDDSTVSIETTDLVENEITWIRNLHWASQLLGPLQISLTALMKEPVWWIITEVQLWQKTYLVVDPIREVSAVHSTIETFDPSPVMIWCADPGPRLFDDSASLIDLVSGIEYR